LGPRNVPLERENPDLPASPYTDSGTIPNLKFSFANARNRLPAGGWSREVTAGAAHLHHHGRGGHAAQPGRDPRAALELVKAHLNLDEATTTAVTAYKGKPIIVQ
jgi:hypothetical protein